MSGKSFSRIFTTLLITSSFSLIANPTSALEQDGHDEDMYDTDTQTWAVDTDGDTFPDVTEEIGGYDPLDSTDYPGADLEGDEEVQNELSTDTAVTLNAAGFPLSYCRSGYTQVGSRLCITGLRGPSRYDLAAVYCRDILGRVATYEDLFYIYMRTSLDARYNPYGRLIGNMVGDDDVFRGNRSITYDNDPDIWNFEGDANKADRRYYWCVHDDDG